MNEETCEYDALCPGGCGEVVKWEQTRHLAVDGNYDLPATRRIACACHGQVAA